MVLRVLSRSCKLTTALAFGTVGATLGSAEAAPTHSAHSVKHAAPLGGASVRHRNADHATSRTATDAETIKVSVRKLPTRFNTEQHVGSSTTMISSETLQQRAVITTTDIQKLAPNLQIESQYGSSALNFHLRGVGFNDLTMNNTPSVMPYIDGVAYPISSMTSGPLFDIDSIGVDPGPSGFTHGQTTTGGEVRITTKAPEKQFHAGIAEDFASYNRSKTDAFVTGSITHNLQYRLAAELLEGGGYYTNRETGQSLGDQHTGAIRGKLAWQPDEDTDVDLTGYWSLNRSEAPGFRINNNLSAFAGQYGRDLGYYQTGWDIKPAFAKLIGYHDTKPQFNDLNWGFHLAMAHRFRFGELDVSSAYDAVQLHEYQDQDGMPYATADDYRTQVANSFTQEVSFHNLKDSASRFSWDAGLYYNRIMQKQNNYYDFSDYALRGYMSETRFSSPQETFNQYVTLGYKVLKNLRFVGSISHESDSRQLVDLTTIHFGHNDLNFGTHGALANQFTGKVGIEYQATPTSLFYADIRKGMKPGGFTANNTVVPQQAQPIKPETILAYEIGTKNDFFSHRLRLNAAAFYYDYRDQQVLGNIVVPSYGSVGSYVSVPRSTIWGVEGSMEAHPTRDLTLTQVVGYQRGVYDQFHSINAAQVNAYYAKTGIWQAFYSNYHGVDSGIPKISMNGSAVYTIHVLPHYHVLFDVDYSYRGAEGLIPGNPPYRTVPAYFLLNSFLTFEPNSRKWSATIYATNLADRKYDLTRSQATNVQTAISGPPRFIGGRLNYNF